MIFDPYGKVIIAFFHSMYSGSTTETTLEGTQYEGKLRIAKIDPEAGDPVRYYYRQHGWFGVVGAIAYKDNGTAETSKIYIGGSSDPAHTSDSLGKEWSPSITMING